MKQTLCLIVLLFLASWFMVPATLAGPGEAESVVQEEVPPIVAHMREINRNLRQLRRQLTPDKQEENLKLVREVRTHVEKAREEQPLKTPEIPADERDAFLKGFRELLSKVLDILDKLESSLREGDLEQAQTHVLALNEIREEGHEKYQKEE